MNQTQTRKSFFPMHPAEYAAFDQGVDAGVEKERTEVRQSLLQKINRLAPDLAMQLAGETDVEVLMDALARAGSQRGE
jgi:hypothetical protein